MDNFNVPPVDLAWDYATPWELVHGMRNRLNELIKYMEQCKKSTHKSDKYFQDELELIINTGVACTNLIDFEVPTLSEILED